MASICNEMGSLRQNEIYFNGVNCGNYPHSRNVFKTDGDMSLCNKVPKTAA